MVLILADGRRFPLERSVVSVGSGPGCDLVLVERGVKVSHAFLVRDSSGLSVMSAGKDCSVELNGKRVSSALLRAGDRLKFGKAELVLEDAPAAGQRASPPPSSRTPSAEGRVLQLLSGFAVRLLARKPTDVLLGEVLTGIQEAVNAESGFIVLGEGARRRVVASTKAVAEDAVADTLVERVLMLGVPIRVDDVASDATLAGAPSVVSLRVSSLLAVPLRSPGRPPGALYLGRRLGSPAFSQEDLDAAFALSSLAALLLAHAGEMRQLSQQLEQMTDRLSVATFEGLIGESSAMRELYRHIERLAPLPLNVLIQGETGTGKELVARALHRRSGRTGPWVALSCAAVPEALAERELFGHVRGAFTGATRDVPGVFEAANGGTLFLDEVGEMPLSLQVKLLRVLQEREVTRLGDTKPRRVDVRILCASHVALRQAVESKRFREDLLYRLDEVAVRVPALRERGEDALLIAHAVLRAEGARARGFTLRAQEILLGYPFPGNVRELVSVVRRAALLGKSELIQPEELGLDAQGNAEPSPPLEEAKEAFVRRYVREAVARAGGNKKQAAAALGVGLRSLFRYLEEPDDA